MWTENPTPSRITILKKTDVCVYYKHMPGQPLLCLQLAFTLDRGFKDLTEQSGKQTRSYLLLQACCSLMCIHSRSKGRCGVCCSAGALSESQGVGRAPADLLMHLETQKGII